MTRARGLLLGGACFATLIGANGGALAPVVTRAATVPARAAVRPATSRPVAAAASFTTAMISKARPVSSRPWRLAHVGRSSAPTDVSATVTSVVPAAGPSGVGTSITINGTGFTDARDVVIGGTVITANPCPSPGGCFTFVSDTVITATTPPDVAGSSDVTVDNLNFPGTLNPPSDYYTFLDQPTVTNVASPQSEGATGITVTGTNFSIPGPPTTSAVTEVDLVPTFTGPTVALATPCSSSGQPDCFDFTNDTHMPIDLPATNIAPGQYDTVVVTPGGTSTTPSSDLLVVQQDAPAVTSVSPDSGPQSGGSPAITIHGTGFSGTGFTTTDVSFGGTSASFSVTNSTTIAATPPAGTGLVDITVTTSSTDGTSVQTSATAPADTYVYAPVPTVTGVSPPTGPTGGHNGPIVVTGTGFESNNGVSNANFAATDVFVGATDVSIVPCPGTPTNPCFTINSATKITLQDMPVHAVGPVDITVHSVGGVSAISSGDKYTYQVSPAVTGVSPTAGVLGGGNNITVTGSDFTGATTVFVGANPISPCPGPPCFTATNTTISIQGLPSHAAGTVDITVETPGGTSPVTAADEYAYAPVPTVTNVTPGDGPIGGTNTITIAGTGFSSGSLFSATRVMVDTTSVTATPCPSTPTSPCFDVGGSTSITVRDLPGHAAGTVDITVTTAGGLSLTSVPDQYQYVAAPTVTAVVPPTGPAGGGNSVGLTGTNFQGTGFTTSDVLVGATDISTTCPGSPCFIVNSPASITVNNMPLHAAGPVDITVQTPGGTSPLSGADQYTYEPLPTVTSVSPADGVLAGGNTVTVNGTGFPNTSVVNVGTHAVSVCPGSPCFNIVSTTQITVDSFPANGSAATVDITVTTPLGTSVTSSADTYTYMPVPTVTNVSPNAGALLGTNSVTVTGTGFQFGGFSATTVTISDVGNPAFTVTSATSITIPSMLPTASGGIHDITVTTAGGTSAITSADRYTYVAAFPTVTTVSPKFGAAGGNAYVTVLGANFGDPTQGFGATDILFSTVVSTKDIPSSNAFPCPGSANGCFQQIGTTTIDVYTPAFAAGTVDIQVVTGGGTSNTGAPDKYTYIAPGAYTAVNPFRICDTRHVGPGISPNPCNAAGKGTLGSGKFMAVQMTGGPVPVGAQAVVVNITAIDHGPGGTYVVAYPAGGSAPGASNINLNNGAVGSNLAIVQLGTLTFAGQIDLLNAAGSADVIVDVEGYFATPAGSSEGAFHSVPPLRICDSRGGMGTECAPGAASVPLKAGAWVKVVLSGVPIGGSLTTPHIPSDGTAAAAAFNLTGTAGTAPTTFLAVAVPTTPGDACPNGAPSFSNMNPAAGTSLPNRVISNLGPTQDICLYNAAGSINYVIDVNGWFGKASAAPGAFFYSVPPTRICDTRPSLGSRCQGQPLAKNAHILVHVAGIVAVPAWFANAPPPLAVVANLTGVAGTAATYLVLYPADATSPPRASDLNPTTGQVIANLTITSLAQTGGLATDGNLNLYNALGTINAILDVAGWFQ